MSNLLVIDVPERLTPEEAAALLNAPGEAFFVFQVLPIAGGHRAYLRRYKEKPATKAEAMEAAKDEATALSIVRVNRDASLRVIVDLLKKAGIKRGKEWVSDKLEATCAEDGKEEQAVALVKGWAAQGPHIIGGKDYGTWEPKDVVDELRLAHKIKRSIVWARRKLEEFRAVRPQLNP